jgi:DmsE family decaheme c-type cytochrome
LGFVLLGFGACKSSYRPARRMDVDPVYAQPTDMAKPNNFFHQASYASLTVPVPEIEGAEYVNDDEFCLTCHQTYAETFQGNVHRGLGNQGQSCEACHGPASRHLETRGQEKGLLLSFKDLNPAAASELCLRCHEENACEPGAEWRYSVHAHNGVACVDCHTAHYNVPPGTPATTEPSQVRTGSPDANRVTLTAYRQESQTVSLKGTSNNLNAAAPNVCYKCHCDMQEYQMIAGPHQICGPNGFNCTTCHDPHGKIRETTRKDLCLDCHKSGSPTMAFHSSTHNDFGVACTDCHNPHPRTRVPLTRAVALTNTKVNRPKRLAMAVDEPGTCFKCHPKIFGLTSLPSHHPIKEGLMTCSDCHDAHGQDEGNLKAERLNLLCWKCHADKQGPFVYEHPPVTEDCGYCHNPHGSVANNLLHQPTTVLCLRCHSGHRARHNYGNIDTREVARDAFYTDCTVCHAEIHGSDLPSSVRKQSLRR